MRGLNSRARRDDTRLLVDACCASSLICRWWKDLHSKTYLSFARDRMVEIHFWILGTIYEPYYSYSRIVVTKFTLLASLLDDLYDNYCCTTEESTIFNTAIERFAQLPSSSSNNIRRFDEIHFTKHLVPVIEQYINRWQVG